MTTIEDEERSRPAPTRRWRFRVGVTALVIVLVPIGLGIQAFAAAFTAHWVAVTLSPTHHEEIEAAWLTDGGRTLGVTYMHGACDESRQASLLEESVHRVVLSVTYKSQPRQLCLLIGYNKVSYFTLDQPLGERRVFYESDDGLHPLRLGEPMPPGSLPPTEFRVDG